MNTAKLVLYKMGKEGRVYTTVTNLKSFICGQWDANSGMQRRLNKKFLSQAITQLFDGKKVIVSKTTNPPLWKYIDGSSIPLIAGSYAEMIQRKDVEPLIRELNKMVFENFKIQASTHWNTIDLQESQMISAVASPKTETITDERTEPKTETTTDTTTLAGLTVSQPSQQPTETQISSADWQQLFLRVEAFTTAIEDLITLNRDNLNRLSKLEKQTLATPSTQPVLAPTVTSNVVRRKKATVDNTDHDQDQYQPTKRPTKTQPATNGKHDSYRTVTGVAEELGYNPLDIQVLMKNEGIQLVQSHINGSPLPQTLVSLQDADLFIASRSRCS